MTSEVFRKEIVKTDVLCIGGGIAGLMGAIRAAELGADTIVVDKGNTLRSGAGGMGNDHFQCYIPEIHGTDTKPIIEGYRRSPSNSWREESFIRTWLERSSDIVKLWDTWGIPMKREGKYEFAGHGLPGKPLIYLKYSGQNQKPTLTREALKRGVQIMNRVMIFDLLNDQGRISAIGIDTRKEKIIMFQTKSIILGTGRCARLYPGLTPGWMFNIANFPGDTGDGRAMAYRAGAELTLLEMLVPWAGPKYFSRCGKATWIGVFKDSQGKPIGPFVTKPERKYGDVIADLMPTIFEDYAKSGKGPVYMDCGGITPEDYDYMLHYLEQEGNTTIIDHFKAENIDFRKNPIEFTTYGRDPKGGILYNEKGETSVRGLYAAGDERLGGISHAAVFGWLAGENAAKYSKQIEVRDPEKDKAKFEEKIGALTEIRNRDDGVSWYEANIALQQIMFDYAGLVRSESLLQAGFTYLQRLKQKVHSMLMAENQHELMHCLEVLNMLDVGELIFITALERKETRATHVRTDYPFTNPLLDKPLIVKKENDATHLEWREVKR